MQNFNGKVAVITGGAGGVGRCLGLALAQEGARVVVADIDEVAIARTVDEIKALGAEAVGMRADVTQLEQLAALADKTFDTYGGVHMVFANAGIGAGEFGNLWDYSDNDWTWSFNVNVWGVINTIRAFMPRLVAQDVEAHFVITGSANGGVVKLPYTPIYTCTKAAVQSITENLYQQLKMMNSPVKVNALFPGPHSVDTGIFDSGRNRPDDLPEDPDKPDTGIRSADDMINMMELMGVKVELTQPEDVARDALEGIRNDKFWILPLTSVMDEAVKNYHESIQQRSEPPIIQLDG